MARSFSPSLSLSKYRSIASSLIPSSKTIFFRSQSSNRRSNRTGELYEIDTVTLQSQSQSDPLIQKLEDAVHRIMVRRSAPDWLPFVPGGSYWVPPPRSQTHGIAKLVEKLANPIGDEESISISSARGWPSSDYFIKGVQPQSVETEMVSNTASNSEDEEGVIRICRFLRTRIKEALKHQEQLAKT